nr:uncharacterized protein LOC111852405 [Paramormyrops kingsleyae]
MVRLRNNYSLPCLQGCPNPLIVSAGVGRPQVVVGTGGQYYILSSRLSCKACRRNWFADSPRWLEKLPKGFTNILPAFLTCKKAICKSVMDELRQTGKSPTDMANQVNELMHLKYKRAHLAYLHAIESVRDAEDSVYGQRTIWQFLRKENTPHPFGPYENPDGWGGVSVSGFYLTDCLLEELTSRASHIQTAPGYSDAGVEKAGYHWMDRRGAFRECTFSAVASVIPNSQLNYAPDEDAKVPIWIPVRGTSQQEGYHFYQAQWITGTHVSIELFQAQGMTGVARWNYQRLVDLKQPGVILPAVFDPVLMTELNSASQRVTGKEKYPALHLSDKDTGEKFGCHPVPLDWDKHRTQKRDEPAASMPPSPMQTPAPAQAPNPASSASPGPTPSISHLLSAGVLLKQEMLSEDTQEPPAAMETSHALPLPLRSSPRRFCIGPHKLDTTHERSY